ncbi:MAG: DNA primase [Oscillospiraceae bacterium]|jgi:putative DNA primase/helicase|nr:DNA primase [Oscillospiraceae bacterium]MBQ5523309.1 DNA primase [Oscillospiraceae bacterium]
MAEQKKLPPNRAETDFPDWYDGKKVDEVRFCREFLAEHPMICVKGSFFTVDGRVNDEEGLRKQIYGKLSEHVKTGLSRRVDGLLNTLKVEAYWPDLPVHTDRIHVANGTLFLDGTFTTRKEYCRNRLPVRYDPNADMPPQWITFLDQLLETEDIYTLQEFMGYSLLPTTKAQKMLMIVGQGGEGKSRIGVVMRAIFGESMVNGSLAKVETNRFARADLENALVMVDDDMKMEALPETNYLKLIITAELPLDLEKKGKQSYQGELYARFLCFGNGPLKALYDRSQGFFRRQIILTAKKKDPNRRDDPDLSEKLTAEKEGIFLWCFYGLQRLIEQNYRFTLSDQAKANMEAAVSDGNNVMEFLQSKGYLTFFSEAEASTKELYAAYKLWCEDNVLNPQTCNSFSRYLNENQELYHIRYSNNIYVSGRRVRGYIGIEPEHKLPI